MKKYKIFILAFVIYFVLGIPGISQSADGNDPMAGAAGEFRQAEADLQKAAEEFAKETGQPANPLQQNGQTSWSKAASTTPDPAKAASAPNPGTQALQGSPETGYAGTWTDPANGDTVTTVIAPAPPQNQNQNYPMIIEPQIYGGSGNWNGQSYVPNYGNWPTTPDNPGYPVSQPPYNMPPPPGWHPYYPGQPYPGFNPYPYPYPQPYPGYNQPAATLPPGNIPGYPGTQPPPFNPNYKPLRPGGGNNPGSIWQPGMPSQAPAGFPGGGQPPANYPGATAPTPSQPSVTPLPMSPSGQTWNRPSGQGSAIWGTPGNNARQGRF